MDYEKYDGLQDDGSRVFEDEVKARLKNLELSIPSSDSIIEELNSIKKYTKDKHEELLALLNNFPKSKMHVRRVIKEGLTASQRLYIHNSKLNSSDSFKHSQSGSMKSNDASSVITGGRFIFSSDVKIYDLFDLEAGTTAELTISTPMGTFKGLTSVSTENGNIRQIFFSDSNECILDVPFKIYAYMKILGGNPANITIGVSYDSQKTLSNDNVTYAAILPLYYEIKPIYGQVKNLYLSFDNGKQLSYRDSINLYGLGDLSNCGHGPIDLDVATGEVYSPNYYKSGYTGECITDFKRYRKNTNSKVLRFKLTPQDSGSELPNSHILKPTFGNSNFDMYNLMMNIYDFSQDVNYKCTGIIVINSKIIPVVGFKLNHASGKVSFKISETYKFKIKNTNAREGIECGKVKPNVDFRTNIKAPVTLEPYGFIGDVTSNGIGASNLHRNYNVNLEYDLSLVDINIFLDDSGSLLSKFGNIKGSNFRYSGDFDRYNYNFNKHDHDSYPYPGNKRDINDNLNAYVEIPSLNPEALTLSDVDANEYLTWTDDEDDFITFTSNKVK